MFIKKRIEILTIPLAYRNRYSLYVILCKIEEAKIIAIMDINGSLRFNIKIMASDIDLEERRSQ